MLIGGKDVAIYYSAIIQGILYSIMGIGLYISFRILNFADMTSESSFTIGATTCAVALMNGVHPIIALVISFISGSLAGLVTGILMTIFKIPGLLAGIISFTGLYSVNLRILGKANAAISKETTIYHLLINVTHDKKLQVFIIGSMLTLLIILLLSYLFKTDFGQSMIATGDNEVMASSLGVSTKLMKCAALMTANGLIAVSGALVAQNDARADVTMGVGTVIVALASIIIGEVLFKNLSLKGRLFSIIIGASIYRLLLTFVLKLGFKSSDNRLISAILLAFFLAFPLMKQYVSRKTLRDLVR